MNYIEEVANCFLNGCLGISILDPDDYALIAEWEKQEIPLEIVITSMMKIFDYQTTNKTCEVINSIVFFQHEINKNYTEWLQTQ
jgi:hypothetical protein